MRGLLRTALLLAACLGGCDRPPADAYVDPSAIGAKTGAQVAIGKNAVGEACTQTATEDAEGGRAAAVGSLRRRAGGPTSFSTRSKSTIDAIQLKLCSLYRIFQPRDTAVSVCVQLQP